MAVDLSGLFRSRTGVNPFDPEPKKPDPEEQKEPESEPKKTGWKNNTSYIYCDVIKNRDRKPVAIIHEGEMYVNIGKYDLGRMGLRKAQAEAMDITEKLKGMKLFRKGE